MINWKDVNWAEGYFRLAIVLSIIGTQFAVVLAFEPKPGGIGDVLFWYLVGLAFVWRAIPFSVNWIVEGFDK